MAYSSALRNAVLQYCKECDKPVKFFGQTKNQNWHDK